jgi:hypothetical protein
MQRIRLLFLVLVMLGSAKAASAQFDFIKTDVLGPFVNNPFQVSYERNFNSANSFLISAEGGWYMRDEASKFGQPFWEKKITGYGGILEYRRYLLYTGRMSRPVGLFTGVYARGIMATYTLDVMAAFEDPANQDAKETTLLVGGGPILGYKYKKPYSPFFVEVLGGIGWGMADFKKYSADDLPDQYFLWRWELSIGMEL